MATTITTFVVENAATIQHIGYVHTCAATPVYGTTRVQHHRSYTEKISKSNKKCKKKNKPIGKVTLLHNNVESFMFAKDIVCSKANSKNGDDWNEAGSEEKSEPNPVGPEPGKLRSTPRLGL